jgi:hypothetical protein
MGLNVETDTRTDSTFQGSFYTPGIEQPDEGLGCVTQPKPAEQTIQAGQEAWVRLKKCKTWVDWLLVGETLLVGRAEAMRAAHSNKPQGRRYNEEIGDWLKTTGLSDIHKSTRSRLFECLAHRKDIEAWLAALTTSERLKKLNHPEAVLRHWKSTIVKKPDDGKEKKPSQVERLTASLIESEEERAELKREVERGCPFTRQDTARDIAGVVFRMTSPSKAREVARELNRLARQAAEACA